ncbi:MAG: VanW family protein [Lachnospirales bacterium]
MKKLELAIITLMLVFTVSCSNGDNVNEVTEREETETSNPVGKNTEKIVEINGIEVDILDDKSVTEAISTFQSDFAEKTLEVIAGENTYVYSYVDLGTDIDEDRLLTDIKDEKEDIELKYIHDENVIQEVVSSIASQNNVSAVEPYYQRIGSEFQYTEGSSGKSIDQEKLKSDILDALQNTSETDVTAEFVTVSPTFTVADLQESTDLLGSASTSYASSAGDRNVNLDVATSKINNKVLYPGDIFSTSTQYGPVTEANGFAVSKVIVNNELVDGVGGGVCQISSTLYNATLKSELEIVERLNHSLKVGYSDYAYDATVAEGWIDYRFKNSTNYPVLVESYLDSGNRKVVVNIYGNEYRDSNRSIDFYNSFVSSWEPPADKITYDESKPEGYVSYEVQPKDGVKYSLYKNIYVDGALQETVLVNTSTYSAVQGEKIVGKSKPTEATEETDVEGTETEVTEPETEVTEPEVTEPTEPEVTTPTEPEVTEPTEPEVTEPTEPEVTEPTEPEVTEPTEPEVTEPTDPEVTTPETEDTAVENEAA